jgi:hypothetical protein
MYRCNECGSIFEELGKKTELVGECRGTNAYTTWPCCPICGSEDFEEGNYCDCGEFVGEGEKYCPDCLELVTEAINECVKRVGADLNIDESEARELISERLDK